MTGAELRRSLGTVYREREGVRFFSEKALLFALLEKRDLPRDFFLQQGGQALEDVFCREFLGDAERLLAGEPLQYYLGSAFFCGYEMETAEGVLIPRADTEVLVEQAVKILPQGGVFFDFCCGSGCIAAALALLRPDLSGFAFDLSPDALALTKKNLARHGLTDRVKVERLDVLSPGAPAVIRAKQPDLILSNPPYLDGGEMEELPENVRREPAMALFGGADGLDFYRAFARQCRESGVPYLVEMGFSQGNAVREILEKGGLEHRLFRDGGGRERALFFRPGKGAKKGQSSAKSPCQNPI